MYLECNDAVAKKDMHGIVLNDFTRSHERPQWLDIQQVVRAMPNPKSCLQFLNIPVVQYMTLLFGMVHP